MAIQQAAVELYYGGAWQSAPAYVRDPISIVRGRRDEQGGLGPSTASLTLDDRAEIYNPRNPMSPLYGEAGRNTPIRIGVDLAVDDFDRTVSNGWGSTDGTAWSGSGSDYSVSGGAGRHSHGTVNVLRRTVLATSLVDAEQVYDVSTPVLLTGAALVTGVLARYVDSSNYYWLRAELNAGGTTVRLKLTKRVAGVETQLADLNPVPDLAYAADTPIRVRAMVQGHRLAIKAWTASGTEPAAWQLESTDTSLTGAGATGLQTWLVGGNTNVLPVVVSHDNYGLTDRRLYGEVASWKPGRSVEFDPATGRGDAWTEIEAAGILRRLSQAPDTLPSALHRATLDDSPTAYWPLEDGEGATSAASAVAGVPDMTVFGYSRFQAPGTGTPVPAAGLPVFGSGSGIPGSASVVDLSQGGVLNGLVPAGSSGGWRIEWTMVAPRDRADSVIPIRWTTDGTWNTWEFQIDSAGLVSTFGTGLTAAGSGSSTWSPWDGKPHHYAVWAIQSGSVTSAVINVDGVQVASYDAFVPPMTGSPGSIRSVIVNPLEEVNGTAAMPVLGHVTVWNTSTPALVDDHTAAALGHPGETAADRLTRLGDEQDLNTALIGDAADTQPMGAQLVTTLVAQLAEIERTDDGQAYEPRDGLGVVLRTRVSLYNQTPRLTVAYDGEQVAPPLDPVLDDQQTRNDVTAVSTSTGVSSRAVLETGRMSVLAPPVGAGRYAARVDVNPADNAELSNHAGWHLHKGTTDEVRFAAVTVDLVAVPALLADATAVDVGDLIEVTGLPAAITPDVASLLVIGYVETIGAATRTITFVCIPASAWTVATADGDPRVPADGSTLAAGIDADDLALSLASTTENGPWTTDPADFPQDLRVGGERVTATGITGSTSPQTVTLSARAVNGVTRSWPAGTEVDVWVPAVAPL